MKSVGISVVAVVIILYNGIVAVRMMYWKLLCFCCVVDRASLTGGAAVQ